MYISNRANLARFTPFLKSDGWEDRLGRHAFKLREDDTVPETMRVVCAKKSDILWDRGLSKLCQNVRMTNNASLRELKMQCANIWRHPVILQIILLEPFCYSHDRHLEKSLDYPIEDRALLSPKTQNSFISSWWLA